MFKKKLQSIEEGNSKVENWARLVRRECKYTSYSGVLGTIDSNNSLAEQETFNRVKDIQTREFILSDLKTFAN